MSFHRRPRLCRHCQPLLPTNGPDMSPIHYALQLPCVASPGPRPNPSARLFRFISTPSISPSFRRDWFRSYHDAVCPDRRRQGLTKYMTTDTTCLFSTPPSYVHPRQNPLRCKCLQGATPGAVNPRETKQQRKGGLLVASGDRASPIQCSPSSVQMTCPGQNMSPKKKDRLTRQMKKVTCNRHAYPKPSSKMRKNSPNHRKQSRRDAVSGAGSWSSWPENMKAINLNGFHQRSSSAEPAAPPRNLDSLSPGDMSLSRDAPSSS